MSDLIANHRRACDGFSEIVSLASGRWNAPSPCTDWDARGVLEHVIGFHDQLLLKPLDAKPERPKDDPQQRWLVTVQAIFDALAKPEALEDNRASPVGVLTTDVLVHTWDLATAVGVEVELEPDLCQIGYARAVENQDRLAASDMFGPPVAVAEDADVQSKLLGIFGRDPRRR